MELEEIVERCKNGEQQAQSWVYKKYSRQMLRICYRFVADKQIAQDLMHDGFIIVFTSIHSLQQPEKIENWMGRIMTNLALRYIHQTRSISTISLSDLSEELQPAEEEDLSDALPLETLLMIVEKLPEGYRNVFKLSVLDGLSHKEIGELLHIAPHSSSSQFYRAKEHLKKMIIQYLYLPFILMILWMPICLMRFWKDTPKRDSTPPIAIVKQVNKDTTIAKPDRMLPVYKNKHSDQQRVRELISLAPDTITTHNEDMSADTAQRVVTSYKLKTEKKKREKRREHFTIPSTIRQSGWAFAFEYHGSRSSTNRSPKNVKTPADGNISSSPVPPYTNNWNDYYRYLKQYGQESTPPREVQSLMAIAQRNNGMIEEKRHHHLPFTIGVLLHKSLNKHWGVETGVHYTRLVSDFETGNDAFIAERQKLHYIGIPLRGTYRWHTFKQFSIYSSVGITVEIPVSASVETQYIMNGEVDYQKQHSLKAPLQWSVNSGLGIHYQLTTSVGLFAEPKLHYYFNDGSELQTSRKEHPLHFSLPVGIRFSY